MDIRPLEIGNSLCSILIPDQREHCISKVAAELIDELELVEQHVN